MFFNRVCLWIYVFIANIAVICFFHMAGELAKFIEKLSVLCYVGGVIVIDVCIMGQYLEVFPVVWLVVYSSEGVLWV